MRMKIVFSLPKSLVLPLSYHYMVQGFLYHCLSENPDFSEMVHERGYGEERAYKLFCFSLLKGEYQVVQRQIVFRDKITLQIGSIDEAFIQILCSTLIKKKYFQLNRQDINLESFEVLNDWIDTISIKIQMISPVTVHRTILDENMKKKTIYYSPWDAEFEQLICDNYIRKYKTYYGIDAKEYISIVPVYVSNKDKYVTNFKGQTIITAWKGVYRLTGSKEALNFLYQTGIGDRNSQGFGMFEIYQNTKIEKE